MLQLIEENCRLQREADELRTAQAAELHELKHGTPIIDPRSKGEKIRLVDSLLKRAVEHFAKS
jgi:hypothetical protein